MLPVEFAAIGTMTWSRCGIVLIGVLACLGPAMGQAPNHPQGSLEQPGAHGGSIVAAGRHHRTVCFTPPSATERPRQPPVNLNATPDRLYGIEEPDASWQKYMTLWRTVYQSPSNESIRRYFGWSLQARGQTPSSIANPRQTNLEASNRSIPSHPGRVSIRKGRSAPRYLRWRSGSYLQVETAHFQIFARTDSEIARHVAAELEQCYWVWTQMFFPLWEGAPQVAAHLKHWDPQTPIDEHLRTYGKRITLRRRLRVVLFRDAEQYAQTLRKETPGIERSTGYYNDQRRTTYLFASRRSSPAGQKASGQFSSTVNPLPGLLQDDTLRETLRHELVHQLFREATNSSLGANEPGQRRDFWLVEGVAGYFESLAIRDGVAVLGGWDSPRLQFARFRMLAGADTLPLDQLRRDGRVAVQASDDLPRWYAHAIAQTHRLFDSGDMASRQWYLRKLADLYRIAPYDDQDLFSKSSPQNKLTPTVELGTFLRVTDEELSAESSLRNIRQLCLSGCKLSGNGLNRLPVMPRLEWLDLSRMPVTLPMVQRMVSRPDSLTQLSLELTEVDDASANWLQQTVRLRELDLSWTACGDAVISALAKHPSLETLWMTGTRVSDQSIDTIAQMKSLARIDLQRTALTESGLARLRQLRPQLEVNPIELRSQ